MRDLLIGAAIGIVAAVLLVSALLAVYPQPKASAAQLRELTRQQQTLDAARKAVGKMSASHEAMYRRLQDQVAAQRKAVAGGRVAWTRNASALLLVIGLALMGSAVALVGRTRVLSAALVTAGIALAIASAALSMTAVSSSSYAVTVIAIVGIGGAGYAYARLDRRDMAPGVRGMRERTASDIDQA